MLLLVVLSRQHVFSIWLLVCFIYHILRKGLFRPLATIARNGGLITVGTSEITISTTHQKSAKYV